jgi:hypothetical protein
MDKIALVIYTHSQYSDAWSICFEGHELYTQQFKKYIFLDKHDDRIPENYTQIIYTDGTPYTNRFKEGLEKVTEKYIILTHEDFFLYDKIDYDKIRYYMEVLENNQDLSFIRLLKCGETSIIPFDVDNLLYKIPDNSNHIFAIQASIWNKDQLYKVYNNNSAKVPSIMEKYKTQKYCKNNKIKGLYAHNVKANKRGRRHWDSSIYPYMATGIVAGKWNYSEYKDIFEKIFDKHDIDKHKRGTI